jgi:hypothetical protein
MRAGRQVERDEEGDRYHYCGIRYYHRYPRIVISNWVSSYATIDYLAMWEGLYNPDFHRMEFQTVRNEPGRLVMTPTQWIEKMNAIGIVSKAGRYGGTYAHSDIAFEFASWDATYSLAYGT